MSRIEPEPIEDIVPHILRDYSDEPRGWRVMSTPQGDMLVLGPTSAFQLKLIPLNPREVTGTGAEIPEPKRVAKRIRKTPEFGLRPLLSDDIKDLLQILQKQGTVTPKLTSILERAPLTAPELEASPSEHILSGPILNRPDIGSLDPELMKMQLSLSTSAQEVFRRRYPMRAGMFF